MHLYLSVDPAQVLHDLMCCGGMPHSQGKRATNDVFKTKLGTASLQMPIYIQKSGHNCYRTRAGSYLLVLPKCSECTCSAKPLLAVSQPSDRGEDDRTLSADLTKYGFIVRSFQIHDIMPCVTHLDLRI